MKKAKMMLTAITIFTLIGGGLAFKAKNNHPIYCAPFAGLTCSSNTVVVFPATLIPNGNGIILTSFCTSATSQPCTKQVPVYRLLSDN